MSANAESKANDSAGSATVSDGNDTVQHPINTSSVGIFEWMTGSVTCKAHQGAHLNSNLQQALAHIKAAMQQDMQRR